MENPVYGECAKHKGNSMFDCPMCAMEKGNDFVFDVLKTKGIVLPPCDSANGKSAEIDSLPAPTKYVWVTYDPLYERVVCVHEKLNQDCKKCRTIRKQRWKEDSPYFLETSKFKVKL